MRTQQGSESRIAPEEIAVFCEQVSLILESDIPLYDGIDALCEDGRAAVDAAALERMNARMKETGSFAAAVEGAGIFPQYMTAMVRVGEESGNLPAIMRALAAYYMRQAHTRRSVRSAVQYPLTLVAIMALVILVLVFKVLPIFTQAFESLGSALPGYSQSMMRMGQWLGAGVFAVALLIFAATLTLFLLLRGGRNPQLRRRLLNGFAPLRNLNRRMNAQKFAAVLSMMLSGGFPIEQALELMEGLYADEEDKTLIRACAQRVTEGETLEKVIERTALFDPLYMRMINVGASSGRVDAALLKVADMYAQDIDDELGRLIGLIEPVLVAVLSAMIGAILLSVMLPLASVLSAMA